MVIEFDPKKDAANRAKHGVSLQRFEDMDIDRIIVRATIRHGEARDMVIGPIDGALYAAVVVWRGPAIRVISLRPASRRERKQYAETTS